jgi:hypothetical protein
MLLAQGAGGAGVRTSNLPLTSKPALPPELTADLGNTFDVSLSRNVSATSERVRVSEPP